MTPFPIFLSVVLIIKNRAEDIANITERVRAVVAPLVSDYEIVLVDNGSTDATVLALKQLTSEAGQPNLQVYALTKEVSSTTAAWAGLENALGDFVAVLDPMIDDIEFLPPMLDEAVRGCDVVFARNSLKPRQRLIYRGAYALFNRLYQWSGGVHLDQAAPLYRVLNRRAIHFILQHPQPSMTYRHLPTIGGFTRAHLDYEAQPRTPASKSLREDLNRGIRLLVSTTQAPMRLVTLLSLFGALANLAYSVYVLAVGFFKADVAPGWISMSLQQSGMFFLISLVLLVLGEYILNMVNLANEGPAYYVGQEFTSARMDRRNKLNIEETQTGGPGQGSVVAPPPSERVAP